MIRRSTHQRAFTLIEVVIAIAILGIIMTVAYSALGHIMVGKRILDDGRDASLVANAVLLRLTRELQLIYADKDIDLMPPPGTKTPPRMALMGTPDKLPNGEAGDSVTFLALEGGQYLPDGTHSGVVQITYLAAEDPDKQGADNPTYWLIRREVPHQPDPDRLKEAYDQSMVFPVTKDLVSLEFSYYDAETEQWVDKWAEEHSPKLPLLVRFSVSLRSPLGRVTTYSTAIPVKQPPQ